MWVRQEKYQEGRNHSLSDVVFYLIEINGSEASSNKLYPLFCQLLVVIKGAVIFVMSLAV